MTPRARNASLLVSLVLLCVAVSAHAECAWVMWNAADSQQDRQGWRPVRTFTSRTDCVRELSRSASNWKEGGWNITGMGDDQVVASDAKAGTLRLRCLPESIDPRGALARLKGWLVGW
jgi:hypothetical protein